MHFLGNSFVLLFQVLVIDDNLIGVAVGHHLNLDDLALQLVALELELPIFLDELFEFVDVAADFLFFLSEQSLETNIVLLSRS